MPAKHSYQYVKSFFKEHGCVLLSTKYINTEAKLDYICSCRNTSIITFNQFKRNSQCKICGFSKLKHSYEYIKSFFKEQNCILLSIKYHGARSKLNYICSCGNKSSITFTSFQQNHKCFKCGYEKRRLSCLEKYGVEYPMQTPEIFEKQQKSAFKLKKVITSSGEIIFLRGFEPQGYNKLLKRYSEDKIKHLAKDMPKLWYLGEDGKEHKYYPDFYVPVDNLIIEVKSTWTYEVDLKINLLKQQACLDVGYRHEFMVIPKN